MQRFLRKDDPDSREVFFKLANFGIVRNDLVPLITTYPEDHDIVYNARGWRSWSSSRVGGGGPCTLCHTACCCAHARRSLHLQVHMLHCALGLLHC